MLRPLQAQQLLLGGKMHTRSKACIAFRMLDDKPWHGEPPPVRRDGGDAFSHLSDDERDPKHWALPTQPNLGKLKQMVLAVKQIIGHFKGGKLDGKRWQLRHMHALWNVFFPGTPPPQKLSNLQMHELEADFHPGKIEAVILEAKCALFGDDLLNTAGNAQPAAAATLNALAGGVGVEIGVGGIGKALASKRLLLIVSNFRWSTCVNTGAQHGQRPTATQRAIRGPRGAF